MLVLAVDDSGLNLAVYRSVLSHIKGVSVVPFTEPQLALDWARGNSPDLAIVDYHMPSLDGLQFLERFRQNPHTKETLVVMMSADAEREVRHRALSSGVNDFLNKPIDPVEFQARVRNLLELA